MPITVTGIANLDHDLQQAGAEVGDLTNLEDTLADIGTNAARRAAPARTGKLRRDIHADRTTDRAVVTAGGPHLRYAAVINYGSTTRNITAKHYLDAAHKAILDAADTTARRAVETTLTQNGL